MIVCEKEVWFVHLAYDPPLPLKLERKGNTGATIFGGKTGAHRTGHGESYWDKFVEIVKLGFTPVDVAKDLKHLPEDWAPPSLIDLDETIKSGRYRLKVLN